MCPGIAAAGGRVGALLSGEGCSRQVRDSPGRSHAPIAHVLAEHRGKPMVASSRGISLRQVVEDDMPFLFHLFADPERCHLWMRSRDVFEKSTGFPSTSGHRSRMQV